MKLSLFTPERKIVADQEIEDVLVPAHKGELHILSGHAPLMTLLSTGIMKWRFKGETSYHRLVVSSGYCEISPEGVIVLAEHSTNADEVVVEKFNSEIQGLNQTLLSRHLEDKEWDETQRKLAALQSGLELKKTH